MKEEDDLVLARLKEEDRKFREFYATLPEEKKAPADYLYNEGIDVGQIIKDMEGDVSWYWDAQAEEPDAPTAKITE